MSMNRTILYTRLNSSQTPRKSLILRIVLPLVAVSFVLFCAVGYLSSQPTYHVYGRHSNQHSPITQQYVNQSQLMEQLRSLYDCKSVDDSYRIEQRGNFWVLKNFITPDREQPLRCYETITYTTHADYRFLENIVPLLERWQAPISIAVYAPGEEFDLAIEALRFHMFCHRQSYLMEEYASVHLYFDFDRMPSKPIDYYRNLTFKPYNCPVNSEGSPEPDRTSNREYPVNVGRNIARDAAQTHFVLASDIELYPNPGFIEMFQRMIANPVYRYTLQTPSVYVLPIFEVAETSTVPEDKIELLRMMKHGDAIKFHEKICEQCHTVPNYEEWKRVIKTDETMDILVTAKRKGQFEVWEPIYVGTKQDPLYDERLSWEGKFDKMTQGYIMCVLGYNFHVLDNGFLVHKPGMKTVSEASRPDLENRQRKFIDTTIFAELKILFGEAHSCSIT
ncbi:beta-1,4-glucuronyltransferase 1-like [Topomyia yanbarensis]|uniref:beta-1,4-glucuronyltransferase 1-like n=1 Tax=Topomyia yanbarensis TaxID=2498891 RepID=UPI00273C479E|nr:beta-1,4-glucuronyltransferase 1-like [Topomyia yanbarensis]XP_058819199.1 beta-1,4-glucuronyltransferase 1-like [Topomyia yanbarensis]